MSNKQNDIYMENLREQLEEMREEMGLFNADYQRQINNIGRLVITIGELS